MQTVIVISKMVALQRTTLMKNPPNWSADSSKSLSWLSPLSLSQLVNWRIFYSASWWWTAGGRSWSRGAPPSAPAAEASWRPQVGSSACQRRWLIDFSFHLVSCERKFWKKKCCLSATVEKNLMERKLQSIMSWISLLM